MSLLRQPVKLWLMRPNFFEVEPLNIGLRQSARRAISAWAVVLLTAFCASAETSGGARELEGNLELFLESNDRHARPEGPQQRFSVEVKDGIITIEIIRRNLDNCAPNQASVTVETAVDIRALDLAGARTTTVDEVPGVFLPYHTDVTRTLETASRAQDALIAEARAEHGWGETAAIAATKVFVERYDEALNLTRKVFTYCGGGYSASITSPYEWYVGLKPFADADEFLSLLREYQASLPPEQVGR